jgi:hypothetical protein
MQNEMPEEKKIKPLTEMALLREIVTQAKFAEKAAGRLFNTSDSVEVWESIQSILVAAANVSKILWPVKNQNETRGKQLRELLDVSDDNLLSDRTIRNHFEHYDERIEEWIENSKSSVYMDSKIDPFDSTICGMKPFFHRSYNPTSKMLSFRGESFDLAAILTELEKIREKCWT